MYYCGMITGEVTVAAQPGVGAAPGRGEGQARPLLRHGRRVVDGGRGLPPLFRPGATRWTVFVLTRVSSWSCATCRTPTRGGWTAGTAPGDPDTRRGDPGNTWHVARV